MNLYQLSEATAAYRRVYLHLVDATDGISAETGESAGQPQISKNGAAFGNTTATLTSVGNGAYYVELTATELNALGFFIVRYKSGNTAEAQVMGQVVAFDPYDAVRAGLTALPNANAEASGGLFTRGTGAGQINQDANGRIDVNLEAINTNTAPIDNLEDDYDGTGYTKTNSTIGTVTTLTGHTVQTGDNYARIGAPAGASISADIAAVKAETASIVDDTGTSGVVVAAGSKTGYSLAADQSGVTIGTVTTLTGHTVQTGDNYARLGAPAGASVSADIAAVKTDTGNIETDTQDIQSKIGTPANIDTGGATLADNLKKIADDNDGASFDATTDSLEAVRDNMGTAQTGDVYGALPSNFSDMAITVTTGRVTADSVQGNVTGSVGSVTGSVGSVTGAVGSVTGNVGGNVTGSVGSVAAGGITTGSFAAGAIDAAAVGTGAIDADALGADCITSAKIADDAIGADQIGAAAIVAATFAAGAIDASAIAADAIGASELASDAIAEIANAIVPKKNTAFSNIEFLMVDSTDHVTPKTGLSPSGQRSIDGGGFSAVSGSIAEVSNGIYQFDALAADMNGTVITFRFYASGADDTFLTVKTTD